MATSSLIQADEIRKQKTRNLRCGLTQKLYNDRIINCKCKTKLTCSSSNCENNDEKREIYVCSCPSETKLRFYCNSCEPKDHKCINRLTPACPTKDKNSVCSKENLYLCLCENKIICKKCNPNSVDGEYCLNKDCRHVDNCIFYCKMKNILICSSCYDKCHKKNLNCQEDKRYVKSLDKMFLCQCEHQIKIDEVSPQEEIKCNFVKGENDSKCNFCRLICKENDSKENNEYDSNKITEFVYLEDDKSGEKCNCRNFYHRSTKTKQLKKEEGTETIIDFEKSFNNYYELFYFRKIITNFALEDKVNLLETFYSKRDYLLENYMILLKKYLQKSDDENMILYVINFTKLFNSYIYELYGSFNKYLSSWERADIIIETIFEIINFNKIKENKGDKDHEIFVCLVTFLRKFYIIPKSNSSLLLFGYDVNTSPFSRIIIKQSRNTLYNNIDINENNIKLILNQTIKNIKLCYETDYAVEMFHEYLAYFEILLIYYPKDDDNRFLEKNLNMIKKTIKNLPSRSISKVSSKMNHIAYFLMLNENDKIVESNVYFCKYPDKLNFCFEKDNDKIDDIIEVICSAKVNNDENEDDDNDIENNHSLEIFDLLLNKDDFYIESVNNILNTNKENFRNQFFKFIKTSNFSLSNIDRELEFNSIDEILENIRINFFTQKKILLKVDYETIINELDKLQLNEIFYKNNSRESAKSANFPIQFQFFQLGHINRIIIFMKTIFCQPAFLIQEDEIQDKYIKILGELIGNGFCVENPLLTGMFFNPKILESFFDFYTSIDDSDEFDENDKKEKEMRKLKNKLCFKVLEIYKVLLKNIKEYNYKVDTKYLIEILFSVISTSNQFDDEKKEDLSRKTIIPEVDGTKIYFDLKYTKNDFHSNLQILDNFENIFEIFFMCLEVNIEKTYGLIQECIVKFISVFSQKFQQEFIGFYIYKNIRITKLLYYLNTTYFNFIITNTKLLRSLLQYPKMFQQDVELSFYHFGCYGKYYFYNFIEIQSKFNFNDAHGFNDNKKKQNFILKEMKKIENFIEQVETINCEWDSIERYNDKFFIPILLPIKWIIYKLLRLFDRIQSLDFNRLNDIVFNCMRIFCNRYPDFLDEKERIKKEICMKENKFKGTLDIFFKGIEKKIKANKKLNDELKSLSDNSNTLYKLDLTLQKFLEIEKEEISNLNDNKKTDDEELTGIEKLVMNYKELKCLMNNNYLASLFQQPNEANYNIRKNIIFTLLAHACVGIKSDNDKDNEKIKQNLKNLDEEKKERPVEEIAAERKDNLRRERIDLGIADDNDIKEEFFKIENQQKQKTIDVINYNCDTLNIFLFEAINKLFKIDPKFWQDHITSYYNSSKLIEKICMKELVFLSQPIFNNYYLNSIQNKYSKLSSFFLKINDNSKEYFTNLIEFIRLLCENFNQLFKTLFFKITFDSDTPKRYNEFNELIKDDDDDYDEQYLFMKYIFNLYSAIIKHKSQFDQSVHYITFLDLEKEIQNNNNDYFSSIVENLNTFLIETIQGNIQENFDNLQIYFNQTFKVCSDYISTIDIEGNNYYIDNLINIMDIFLEYFQENEISPRLKQSALKKIDCNPLSRLLVYKTKTLHILSIYFTQKLDKCLKKGGNEKEINLDKLYRKLAIKNKKNEKKKGKDDKKNIVVKLKESNQNEVKNNKKKLINPKTIAGHDFDDKESEYLLDLYKHYYELKKDREKIQEEEVSKSLERLKKEIDRTNPITYYNKDKMDLTENNTDNDEIVDKTFKICLKIYQFFKIISSLTSDNDKYFEFLNKERYNENDELTFKWFQNFKLTQSLKLPNWFKGLYSFLVGSQELKLTKGCQTKKEIFKFYTKIIRSIEVVHKVESITDEQGFKFKSIFKKFKLSLPDLKSNKNDSIIRQLIFTIDPNCLDLKYEELIDIIKKKNFEESTVLLNFIMDNIDDFYGLIKFRRNLRKVNTSIIHQTHYKYLNYFQKLNFFVLQIISLALAIITNWRMALIVKYNELFVLTHDFDFILFITTFIHFVFLGIAVGIYCFIHFSKLQEKLSYGKEEKEKQKKLKKLENDGYKKVEQEEELDDTFLWIDKKLITEIFAILYEDEVFYLIWSFLICSICMFNPQSQYLYSLLLVPVIQFIKEIQDILTAMKNKVSQFISAGVLLITLVFVYTIIAISFYKNLFIDYDTGINSCGDFQICFLTLLSMGIRGEGIEGDSEEYGIGYIAFTWSFYFAVVLIMLNAINGIIVDIFQYLREKETGENNLDKKCLVCGLNKTKFEANDIKFNNHIKKEHPLLDYLYYILTNSKFDNDKNESLNYSEVLVRESIYDRKIDFFPIDRSISLDKIKDQNEE